MTKMHMANWTKMTVVIGGTGDITLGDVTGFPNISETLGTGKSFYYAFLNVNLSPIEVGFGIMLDAITLQRDVIEAAMIDGVYTADGVTPADIPVGAIMFSAPTKGMLDMLMLEMSLRDYGNVSSAVTMSCQYKALKFNLTANATLTLNQLPPTGAKAEITLHATSANAGTADIGKGYTLTLPTSCKLGKNACPAIPLLHDAETIIKLTTIDGGTTWQVLWYNSQANIRDLGSLTGTIDLDIRYPQSLAQMVAGSSTTLVVQGISPAAKLAEPAHFTVKNNSDGIRYLEFDSDIFTLIGSVLNRITVPLGYKADFTIRRSPLTNDAVELYDVYVNGISYEVSASGLATVWNPSDYASGNLALTNNNLTLEMTLGAGNPFVGVPSNGRSARAFGGKSSGKWIFASRVDALPAGGSGQGGWCGVGVGSAAIAVNSFVGLNTLSGAFMFGRSVNAFVAQTHDKNVVTTRAAITVVLNDIIGIAVDLETGKGWVNYNGTWLYSGNPETGANPIFTLPVPNIYYPMLSLAELSTGNAGIHTLLNELQVIPVLASAPSFNYWTA